METKDLLPCLKIDDVRRFAAILSDSALVKQKIDTVNELPPELREICEIMLQLEKDRDKNKFAWHVAQNPNLIVAADSLIFSHLAANKCDEYIMQHATAEFYQWYGRLFSDSQIMGVSLKHFSDGALTAQNILPEHFNLELMERVPQLLGLCIAKWKSCCDAEIAKIRPHIEKSAKNIATHVQLEACMLCVRAGMLSKNSISLDSSEVLWLPLAEALVRHQLGGLVLRADKIAGDAAKYLVDNWIVTISELNDRPRLTAYGHWMTDEKCREVESMCNKFMHDSIRCWDCVIMREARLIDAQGNSRCWYRSHKAFFNADMVSKIMRIVAVYAMNPNYRARFLYFCDYAADVANEPPLDETKINIKKLALHALLAGEISGKHPSFVPPTLLRKLLTPVATEM